VSAALRQQLLRAGYSPIPVDGKRPVHKQWQERHTTNVDEIELWSAVFPHAHNTGILTKYMPTIDVDIKTPEAAEAVEALAHERFDERGYVLCRIGEAPKRAIPLRTDQPFAKITSNLVAPDGSEQKVELLCDGQQVVAFGIHPGTGKPYSWHGGSPDQIKHADLPYISEADARAFVDDATRLLIEEHGYQTKTTKPRKKKVNGRESTDWLSFNLIEHDDLASYAMSLQRAGMRDGAAVNFLRSAVEGLKDVDPDKKQRRLDEIPDIVSSARAKIEEPQPRAKRAKGSYMQGKTALASNVGNVLLALEQEPEIMNAFGFDEMLRTEVLLRPLFHDDPHFVPRPVTDADITAVQAHLQWFGFRRLGSGAMHDAINKHARAHSFHPVRDYLDGLRWDGGPRLRTWLATYAGVELTEYSEQIGAMFLIGMAARIYKPGCKLDYMIILEGEQGTLKSTLCATLAGKYFSDQLPDITSKEAFQHLRGKWLVEVAELRAYSRAAIDHFKEFLVRDVERYRPPWGRKEVHEPRQCVFIGSTNKALYLKDETGNRRFWPVKCGEIDIDALRRDRNQLFAEAVALYRGGVCWWPDAVFERQTIEPEQEARFEPDAWEQPIKDYLEGEQRTTILDIAIGALGYEIEPPTPPAMGGPLPARGTPINRFGPRDQQRIAAILVHLGWEPKRKNSERWWQPVTPEKPRKTGG
jgi:hypothetical protein